MTEQEIKMKEIHESLQFNLPNDKIRIREDIVINTTDISRYGFEFFCWRSPEAIAEMDAFIKVAKGKQCFLDVGALYGIFSHVFAAINPRGFVHTIEPSVYAVRQINRIATGRVITSELAFSDHDGIMRMIPDGAHLITKEDEANIDLYHEVQCMKGDLFCDMYDFHPDIIKIDVEGHEVKVLKGLSSILMIERPVICLEVHTNRIPEQGDTLIGLWNTLLCYSYPVADEVKEECKKDGEHRIILQPA